MGMEAAIETILTFTLISSVVTFAVENVKGALENEGLYDEVMLGIGITICVVFDVQLIEAISGKVSALQVGPYVDYLIGGSAMAGGGARLLRRLNRNVSSVKKAAG
tara:strand:+ start:130 stop:447 length:318 start_codon:yes stop_codon:yes gene_type:complete